MSNLRKPVVAGRFYENDPAGLKAHVLSLLQKSSEHRTPCAEATLIGLMAPHAGYIFSGIVAGITLGQIKLPDTLILLGPNHSGRGADLSVWPDGQWLTPLGATQVDGEMATSLVQNSSAGFKADTAAHLAEHSLEVILPFTQVLNPKAKILPICARIHEYTRLELAAGEIAGLIQKEKQNAKDICIIASTDMSHHLPHNQCSAQDALALAEIERLNPKGLFETVIKNRISMCGVVPVTMLLQASRLLGAKQCCITARTNSGLTGKRFGAGMDSVVGYAGAIIAA